MRNVSDEFGKEIKTHILGSKTVYENRGRYEIMWKNMAQPNRLQITL
jgi:hypothetical protein